MSPARPTVHLVLHTRNGQRHALPMEDIEAARRIVEQHSHAIMYDGGDATVISFEACGVYHSLIAGSYSLISILPYDIQVQHAIWDDALHTLAAKAIDIDRRKRGEERQPLPDSRS